MGLCVGMKSQKNPQNETISEACGVAELAITSIFWGRECINNVKLKG